VAVAAQRHVTRLTDVSALAASPTRARLRRSSPRTRASAICASSR